VDSAVHGTGLHTGSCATLAGLTGESFLKQPSGLIIFPSQSVMSAILVGLCMAHANS
jgi:hypothetical protein